MSPFDKISISEILPQREPFLFVDCLVHYDERETVTAFSWARMTASRARTVCAIFTAKMRWPLSEKCTPSPAV